MLIASGRVVETDMKIDADENGTRLLNRQFIRLVAIKRSFTRVDFRFSTFDACYLRDCHFDSCNFTGCRFLTTNLHGSNFSGCNFEYTTFEKTFVDPSILDTECPSRENLKARFARTLRVNYQQLGEVDAVNKAMMIELQATETHLRKEWQSNESYFRKKYRGWRRARSFANWLKFKLLDFIWGNGESAWRLARFVVIVLFLMTAYDVTLLRDPDRVSSYLSTFVAMPEVFLGVRAPPEYSKGYLALVTVARLVLIGFFLAIVVKRFNRR